MSKKPSSESSHKSSKPVKLLPLTAVQQQVMAHVMNSIAFGKYDTCCSVEEMAEHFSRTPSRFMPTLRKLVEKRYLTIRGEALPWVYPTVAAIRKQDKQLSDSDARKILARIAK